MIEVFKTNVTHRDDAAQIVEQIHRFLRHCVANFDLDDCDHILRVQGIREDTDCFRIMGLVKSYGYEAIVLPDDFEPLDEEVVAHESEWKLIN
jgi:hypothetical protein